MALLAKSLGDPSKPSTISWAVLRVFLTTEKGNAVQHVAASVTRQLWDGPRLDLPTPTAQVSGRGTRREQSDALIQRETRGTVPTGRVSRLQWLVVTFCRGAREAREEPYPRILIWGFSL